MTAPRSVLVSLDDTPWYPLSTTAAPLPSSPQHRGARRRPESAPRDRPAACGLISATSYQSPASSRWKPDGWLVTTNRKAQRVEWAVPIDDWPQ